MGQRRIALLGVLALSLLAPTYAAAQSWDLVPGAVRATLAKIGGPDKFTGADAVVVFDRRDAFVEDTGLSRVVQHTLTKALTPAGAKELAASVLPYDPLSADVTVLRCRVFGADGSTRDVPPPLVQDAPDPQNLIYWNSRHKLVPVGRVSPGDAVELVTRRVGFTYALLADDRDDESRFVPPMRGHFYDIVPFWSPWPVIEQSYEVSIPIAKNLQYQFFNGGAEVSDRVSGDRRIVTVTMRDFKPLEREAGMVSWSDVAPKLLLTTATNWKAKAVWFHGVQEDAKCFAVSPELKALADTITAGLARDADKAAALNHWVAENIRYIGLHMGKGEGYTLHPASMTLRDRGGVCKDKAGILVALLRAAGLESYPAMTMAGERIESIAADQFNHCVTVWRHPDGKTELLDPTWVPGVREMWSSREQQQEVLMGLPEGADLLTTPVSPPENHPLSVAILSTLAADGTLSGTVTIEADGQSDAALRRFYRGRPRSEWTMIDDSMLSALEPLAESVITQRLDPDDISRPFSLAIRFRIPGYAPVLDDGSLLVTPLSARHPIGAATRADESTLALKPADRRFPVRVGCSKLVRLTERMALPANATVEGLPEAAKFAGSARLDASWKAVGNELTVDETLALTKRIYTPDEWPSLRAALEAFRKLADTPVTIRVAPARKEKSS